MVFSSTIIVLLLGYLHLSTANSNDDGHHPNYVTVKIDFYGEALCPFCRKFLKTFVEDVWLDVAEDGLRQHINFDMVPWGNAYFATKECGKGPYSSTERACWYKKCMTADSIQTDNDCFAGDAVYQHGDKEGILDIYETCIKVDYSLEEAVAFAYCAEGSILDNHEISASQILKICSVSLKNVDSDAVQKCAKERGHALEIANSNQTPEHPGVPYVLLDGKPLENPMDIKSEICMALKEKGADILPDSCGNSDSDSDGNSSHLRAASLN